MEPHPTASADPRKRDPASDSATAAGVDTPSGGQSLATPPVEPAPEPTGHYGPGYGDTTRVDPEKADVPPREPKDTGKPRAS